MLNPLHHLRRLPRDSRDTLFMLAVIAWVALPQVSHLPLWCSLLSGAVMLWRGWLAVTLRPLPARWWLWVLLVLTVSVFTSYLTTAYYTCLYMWAVATEAAGAPVPAPAPLAAIAW